MSSWHDVISSVRSNFSPAIDKKSAAELYFPIDGLTNSYAYEIFPGLSDSALTELSNNYSLWIPAQYLDFLRCTNGMNLFDKKMCIAGMGYDPLLYRNCKVPTALQYVDSHRTKETPKNWLFFAVCLDWNGYEKVHVCFDLSSDRNTYTVHCVSYDNNNILKSWESFNEWFCEEHSTLNALFQAQQYEIIDIVPGLLKRLRFRTQSNL